MRGAFLRAGVAKSNERPAAWARKVAEPDRPHATAASPHANHDFGRMPIDASTGAATSGTVFRKCDCREPEGVLRRSLAASAALQPAAPSSAFEMATRGSNQSVPYRADMEAAFGERFHDVTAYVGRPREMAMLGAVAATQDTRIAFRDVHPSRETVAHELVHVVQQRQTGAAASGPARLSEPNEPAEQEATRLAARVAAGQSVSVRQRGSGLARQSEPPRPGAAPRAATAPELPAELLAAVQAMLARSEGGSDDDAALAQLGQLAARRLGPQGVVAVAEQAGVPGATRRVEETEAATARGTIHRQAAEAAAATAGTMWWLTLVDGPLPIGDIVYGALILGAAFAASRAIRSCRCTIRYAPPDIMAQCPPRVFGTGVTMHDCQNVAKFTAPQQCRQYYGHCGWLT